MDHSRVVASNIPGFAKFVKFNCIIIDIPWIDVLQRYARAENTYSRKKVIHYGAQILGVVKFPASCSLIMDVIEEALKLNYCEDIKAVIINN